MVRTVAYKSWGPGFESRPSHAVSDIIGNTPVQIRRTRVQIDLATQYVSDVNIHRHTKVIRQLNFIKILLIGKKNTTHDTLWEWREWHQWFSNSNWNCADFSPGCHPKRGVYHLPKSCTNFFSGFRNPWRNPEVCVWGGGWPPTCRSGADLIDKSKNSIYERSGYHGKLTARLGVFAFID